MLDQLELGLVNLRACPRTMPDAAMVHLPAGFEAETVDAFEIGGWVEITCAAGTWEVEFVNVDKFERACIYVGHRRPVVLRVNPARYRLRMAALDKEASSVKLQQLSVVRRIGFFVGKAAKLIASGRPLQLIGRYLATRRSHRGAGAVTGYTMSTGNVAVAQAGGSVEPLEYVTPATMPEEWPGVSIIIPSRDNITMLTACVESLYCTEYEDYEIILIDNGSCSPATLTGIEALRATYGRLRIQPHDVPFNFSALCNRGVASSSKPLILLLNDDTEVRDAGWLKAMVTVLQSPGVGVVGPRLVYPSGDLQHAGVATHLVPGPGHPWRGLPRTQWPLHPHIEHTHVVDAVTGACLLIRRSDYDAAGGMDESRFPITLNDVDLCLKIRRSGRKVVYAGTVELIHKEGQSRESDVKTTQQERRQRELAAFYSNYPVFATYSCYYPLNLRRDTDQGLAVF